MGKDVLSLPPRFIELKKKTEREQKEKKKIIIENKRKNENRMKMSPQYSTDRPICTL